MTFPTLKPSGRDYTPAQYRVKAFNSESGKEVRILYGNEPTGARLNLTYNNLSDTEAEKFIEHFRSVKGTYNTFTVGNEVQAGWSGDPKNLSKDSGDSTPNAWRYAQAPRLQSIKPGVSSVSVDLIAVL